MLIIRLILLLIPSILVKPTIGNEKDFYSSISGLEDLLELERALLDNLKYYVDEEFRKNDQIKLDLDNFESENRKATTNPNEYLSNPVSVFRAMKRSVLDLKDLNSYILDQANENEYELFVRDIKAAFGAMPVEDDLNGAVLGLTRLQKTYRLNASDLANGRIMGTQYSTEMSAGDLFHIGRQLYLARDYKGSYEWLSLSRDRLDSEELEAWSHFDQVNYLEFISGAAYGSKQKEEAHKLLKELQRKDPDNAFAKDHLDALEMNLLIERNSPTQPEPEEVPESTLTDLYEATCRGDNRQTPSDQRPLRCMYTTNNVPFLKIAPFKLEQLSIEPPVVYYHDVVYNSEIEEVFERAIPEMSRSRIGHNATSTYSPTRISKNSWLWLDDHKFLAPIRQRLIDMTQMSLVSAEALQAVNYGIGGHYAPHYDFGNAKEAYVGRGNRIATALFYISDVEFGGATAFPFLKLAVKPIKHSLVFWYNLHDSNDPDFRMYHAGCPVVKGSKWILNLWLHEIGQEFNRPCGLHRTAYLSAQYNSTV